jgi:WD40 repeat protein
MKTVIQIILALSVFTQITMALVVEEIALSKDRQIAAFVYNDNYLRLYSFKNGALLGAYKFPKNAIVNMLVFSPQEEKINLYTDEGNFAWDIKSTKRVSPTPLSQLSQQNDTGQLLRARKNIQHIMDADASAYNHKNHTIWIALDKGIWIWDQEGQKELATIRFQDFDIRQILAISITNDSHYIALALELNNRETKAIILDGSTYQVVQTITAQSGMVYELDFIDNHRLLLHSEYPMEVWDLKAKKRIFNFTKEGSDLNSSLSEILQRTTTPYTIPGSINGIDVNKNGQIALTGKSDLLRSIMLDKMGKVSKLYKNMYTTGYDVRFSPDDSMVVFVYHGERLIVYDSQSAKLLMNLHLGGVPSALRIVKFSPNGRYLAAGSDDGTLNIVDLSLKRRVQKIKLDSGVFSLLWLNESDILAGTEVNLTLLKWKENQQKVIMEKGVFALDISRDDTGKVTIAVGEGHGNVDILDAQYQHIRTLKHQGVGRISFGKDGKYLVSSSESQTTVWDRGTYLPVCHATSQESIWAMAYDTQRHIIYTGGDSGIINRMDEKCRPIK